MALPIGNCCLCGRIGPLSFEHLPPKSAFNNNPVYDKKFEEIISEDYLQPIKVGGKIMQRGNGAYTLCVKCNNDTGAWYGKSYVEWAWEGRKLCDYSNKAPSLVFNASFFPLRVLKQIMCMFFSCNGNRFHVGQSELQKFVLNKNSRIMDRNIRVYAYLTESSRMKTTGIMAKMEIEGESRIYSEMTFRPWGYLLSFDEPAEDSRLIDISFFGNYHYNDWKEMCIPFPLLSVETMFAGDYRTRNEIAGQVLKRGKD